jgi:alpha-L-fucosidase
VHLEIVRKNGALLLNVGPVADDAMPSLQRQRLPSLGAWLRVNET